MTPFGTLNPKGPGLGPDFQFLGLGFPGTRAYAGSEYLLRTPQKMGKRYDIYIYMRESPLGSILRFFLLVLI